MLQDKSICCDGCGAEITWGPVVVHRRVSGEKPSSACKEPKEVSPSLYLFYYCCQDCLDGLGCECAAQLELEEERRDSPGDSW